MYFATSSDDSSDTYSYGGRSGNTSPTAQTLAELAARVRALAQAAIDGTGPTSPDAGTIDALQLALLLAQETLRLGEGTGAAADATRPEARFRREGPMWHVVFADHSIRLRDSLGLGYIRQLLQRPGEKIHSVVLAVNLEAETSPESARRRNWLAPRIAAASERLSALQQGLEEATWKQDAGLADAVRLGIDEAATELVASLGHAGGDGAAHQLVERSRLNVSRAIVASLNRIGRHHPPLAQHLRTTIRLGAFCVYLPDARVPLHWET